MMVQQYICTRYKNLRGGYGVFAITRIRNDIDSGVIGYVSTPVPTNVEPHILPKEQSSLWLLVLVIGFITMIMYLVYKRRQKQD